MDFATIHSRRIPKALGHSLPLAPASQLNVSDKPLVVAHGDVHRSALRDLRTFRVGIYAGPVLHVLGKWPR